MSELPIEEENPEEEFPPEIFRLVDGHIYVRKGTVMDGLYQEHDALRKQLEDSNHKLEMRIASEINEHLKVVELQSKYDFMLNECKDMETNLEMAKEVLEVYAVKEAYYGDAKDEWKLANDALVKLAKAGNSPLSENIGNLRKESDKSDDESKYWEG